MNRYAVVAAIVFTGCSSNVNPPAPSTTPANTRASSPPPVLERGAFRNPAPTPRTVAASSPPHTPVAAAPVRVSVVHVTASEGEDGAGNTIPAAHPVAIDLETDGGWPGTALAVTLYVGSAHFHNVGYPNLTTMRFIVADERMLPAGAEVAITYGDGPDRRRVVAAALPVTR